MAQDKQLPSIILLDRNRFDFHGAHIAGIVTCVFPPEVVSDMEVINRQAFRAHIQSFLQVNKISPTKILVVLSPAICFETLLPTQTQLEGDAITKNFVDTVPFEDVVYRTYKSQKGNTVIAVNAAIIDALKIELSSFGHTVLALVPATMFGILHNQTGLDVKTAQILSENALSSLSLDLTTQVAKTSMPVHQEAPLVALSHNRRLVVLLCMFLVLILILIVLLKSTVLV